jgi:cell pole-organizing protein PopZ
MTNIPKVSLEDSLYVLQLARETALAQNRQAQAKRMMPVVDEMRSLVTNPSQTAAIPPSAGVMGQSDFKTLLNVTQSRVNQPPTVDSTAAVMDRNRLIGAMSEANMSDVDIARQFSITREEVQLVLNVQQKNKVYGGGLR